MLQLAGIASIAVGVVLLLRAASMLRPDLVARLTIDHYWRTSSSGPPRPVRGALPTGLTTTSTGETRRAPSYEEQIAAHLDEQRRDIDGRGNR